MDERSAPRTRTPVPILLYHAITETPGEHIAPFAVSPRAFAQQLDVLVDAGYRCITFGELVAAEVAGRPPGSDGGRVAVITFDDGFADFATAALPALRDRSLVSTLYVTTGWLEGGPERRPGPSDRMLSFAELPGLLAEGVELGAHSHSHPQMDTLRAAQLREELVRPRELLEDVLGRPVTTFAYPHGYNGPRVRRATRAAGYDNACGVRNALHCAGEDVFAISRLMLRRTTTLDQLSRWLQDVECTPVDREAWPTRGWRAYRRARAVVRRRPGSVYA
ncbi:MULTISPECIES: polysaccharide deacetylase family protein [unclassified Geodermatophilus]|uniref:polysaccharide deacetylase family protein n=1 Tax=unclassified Geodermatophilus TaxID=2637632 RepID=UPI003EEC40DA